MKPASQAKTESDTSASAIAANVLLGGAKYVIDQSINAQISLGNKKANASFDKLNLSSSDQSSLQQAYYDQGYAVSWDTSGTSVDTLSLAWFA